MDHHYRRAAAFALPILLQDLTKRGVCQCGGGDALALSKPTHFISMFTLVKGHTSTIMDLALGCGIIHSFIKMHIWHTINIFSYFWLSF
jgi:hypothetical protein